MNEQDELLAELRSLAKANLALTESMNLMARASQKQAETMAAILQYLIESEGMEEGEDPPAAQQTYLSGAPR